MRIGFVITHPSQGSPGSYERIRNFCEHLQRYSVRCSVLTPFYEGLESNSNLEVIDLPSATAKIGITDFGYKLARRLFTSRKLSRLFFSEILMKKMTSSLSQSLQKVLKLEKFDILHAVQPMAALACIDAAKRFSIPVITDLHNIWAQELVDDGVISAGDKTFKKIQEFERLIVGSSKYTTVVSELMKEYIVKNYSVSPSLVHVVRPGASILTPNTNFRNRNVVYAGMVSYREHVDLFAESLPYITSEASFYISDYGDDLKRIKKITNSQPSPRVNYIWFKNQNDVIDHLRKSMIGILTSRMTLSRQFGPALKMFQYMSCGLPIVANNIGGWTNIVKEENIGILTEDNPKKLAEAIDLILNDKELWIKLSHNCSLLVQNKYNWDEIIQQSLLPLYSKVLN